MKRFAILAVASGLALAAAAPASAAVIISAGFNGSAPITLTSNTSGNVTTFFGSMAGYTVSLSANAPAGTPNLETLALSVVDNTATPGTLNLYIQKTGVNPYTGGLLSTFSSNTLTGTATSATVSSAFNGAAMTSHTFTGLGTYAMTNAVSSSAVGTDMVEYDITFTGTGTGTFNGTANLAAVPESATWGMMILGFGMMGVALRSRKAKIAFA